MSLGCSVITVKNSRNRHFATVYQAGRSVFNAPLAPGSVHVDDVATVYIMVACIPLPLC